jgi:gas vesicle protein
VNENGREPERGGGFVAGFVLGALAGVVLAMLVTPQSGEDTRDLLAAKAREAAERARDVAGDVGDKMPGGAGDLLERGRSIVEAARARIDSAISEGRNAADRQRDQLES